MGGSGFGGVERPPRALWKEVVKRLSMVGLGVCIVVLGCYWYFVVRVIRDA